MLRNSQKLPHTPPHTAMSFFNLIATVQHLQCPTSWWYIITHRAVHRDILSGPWVTLLELVSGSSIIMNGSCPTCLCACAYCTSERHGSTIGATSQRHSSDIEATSPRHVGNALLGHHTFLWWPRRAFPTCRSDVGPMSGRCGCDGAATSLRRRADVAAMALRRRADVGLMSLQRHCDIAPTSGRCRADVAAMALRRRSDVGPMSGRCRCDGAATSLRRRADVGPMSLRWRCDVAPTLGRCRADVAAMALRRRSDGAVMALRRRCNGAPMYNMRMHINMSTGHALHGRRQDMMEVPGTSSRRVTHRPDRMSLSTALCTTSL